MEAGQETMGQQVLQPWSKRALGMWRYSSYSPPENRRPLKLRKYSWDGVRTERREPGERGELGVLSSHYCSVTLIVTVKL